MNNQTEFDNDEISLKDLILLVKEYIQECLRNWLLIGVSAVLLGLFFTYRAFNVEKVYTSELSYTAGEGGGLSGLAGGLLGRFVGGGKGGSSVGKMQAMLTSREIMKKTLFTKAEINGENDYLINHHAKIYGYGTEDEPFVTLKNPNLETLEEKKVFKKVHSQIIKFILSQGLNDESGIANFSITSSSEDYAYELSIALFSELEQFYIDSEVGEQTKTLSVLEQRADSVYNLIESKAYGIARLQDSDKGRFFATDQLPEIKAQTELEFLRTVYQEIVKNLETIKFTVASSTPSIKAVDLPMYPLETNKNSITKSIITGIFIGGFLAVIFIIGRKVLRDIMSDDEDEIV